MDMNKLDHIKRGRAHNNFRTPQANIYANNGIYLLDFKGEENEKSLDFHNADTASSRQCFGSADSAGNASQPRIAGYPDSPGII